MFSTCPGHVQEVFAHVCLLSLVPVTQHVQHGSAHRCTSVSECTPHLLCDSIISYRLCEFLELLGL